MKYIAHRTEDGREQLLVEHLRKTTELCSSFAVDELKSIAYYCGIMHDIGKYSHTFQSRIRGKDIRVGDALSGAQIIAKKTENNIGMRAWGRMLDYCIAGHHSGLPDGGSETDNIDMPTLHAILARQAEDYSAYESEINAELPDSGLNQMMIGCKTNEELYERYAFLTRYLYSCLTDADFMDTESFFETDTDRKIDGDFKKSYEKVCDKLSRFVAETELQKARGKVQEQVYQSIESDGDLFTINMPTGSGKTLCSIRAALKMAMEQKKKRIIYVIPYVSIIEQTAQVFEELFGDVLPVIQHQSNYDPDEGAEKHYNILLRRLKNGQCFRQPVLGCREFSVKEFRLVEEFPKRKIPDSLQGDIDLGFMLYHMKFKDGGRTENDNWEEGVFSDKADPVFYRPHMINGVIGVAKYREMIVC